MKLCGFIDVDWVGIPSNQKSTSSGIFSVGSTVVSWYNKKKRSMVLSLEKVEYMVAFKQHVRSHVIWMRKVLVGLFG